MMQYIRKRVIRNPFYKPVEEITDRAKRYRAAAKKNRPAAPKQCNYCGRKKNVGVHHVDGSEDDFSRRNLQWACKSCNARIAVVTKRAGLGRRVAQYNPSRRASMDQYAAAIKVMRGEFDGDVSHAIATIRATPASVRSAYTRRTWPTRRAIYGPSGRQTDLPF
jgi:5-methylcytosine-specific restriction endonuclease McrA